MTDVLSSKNEQTPFNEKTGAEIMNSSSMVSNNMTIGQIESGVKVVNEGGTPLMNRAKSQELKKRDRADKTITAPYSEDQNDIRMGQWPSKVSSYHNNK